MKRISLGTVVRVMARRICGRQHMASSTLRVTATPSRQLVSSPAGLYESRFGNYWNPKS